MAFTKATSCWISLDYRLKKSERKNEQFNDHEIHWHTAMSTTTSRNNAPRARFFPSRATISPYRDGQSRRWACWLQVLCSEWVSLKEVQSISTYDDNGARCEPLTTATIDTHFAVVMSLDEVDQLLASAAGSMDTRSSAVHLPVSTSASEVPRQPEYS